MKTINKRIALVVAVVMVFTAFFSLLMFSMLTNAEEYALKGVNAHLFENGILVNAGEILDVNGNRLAYSESGERKYNDNSDIRAAMLHILGDNKGFIADGIQDSFKKELCGYNLFNGVNAESKKSLYLTLDAELCAFAYNRLSPYKGCAAVCNYKTGELICLASTPSYDIYNKPDDIDSNPAYDGIYINRFFDGLYTPGSVFKLVTAYAAIENIPDIYEREFFCEGEKGNIICNDVHGTVNFKNALNQSCNIAFAEIAAELGADVLSATVDKLGLNNKYSTPDRITTSEGIFNINSKTDNTELGWAGIGQSTTLVNPYAFLTFICAVANGGEAYEPYFVSYSADNNGIQHYVADKKLSDVKISHSTASLLRELMRTTVSDFYGDYLFGDVVMCGKTGTAEKDDGLPNAWFAGFSYDDTFPYAVVVVMEDSGSGLKFAGNAASEIMQEIYNKYR